ncbi:hypothetical protein SAY86_023356 [Trapa natans]|uniref:F-box domain-containing protein n=1 Tax=Trapa natans TaxID=22666 RepID=A0AAN7MA94_TRANT|nr:hypothetical protein SAY86_023356 [Trapa natans]
MELPTETITEILVRLPVRSLLRCKRVCRSWRSLIEDPCFIAEHLKWSSCNRFLFTRYYSDSCSKYFISLLSSETLEVLRRIEIPYADRSGYFRIISSSNGIVCLASNHGVSLANPATGDFKLLTVDDPPRPCDILFSYGFGYNRRIDDYKLIQISGSTQRRRNRINRARVFSLNTGMWREITSPQCDIIYKFEGTVVEGIVHWIANGGASEVILSLDLADDKFGQQPLPDISADDGNFKRLCVCDESLILMVYSDSRRVGGINIWVRNSHDLQWTRLASIQSMVGIWRPVGMIRMGDILIENNYGKLAAFDANTGDARYIRIDATNYPVQFDFLPYVESLVMIKR